jgi:transposase InsO family protein
VSTLVSRYRGLGSARIEPGSKRPHVNKIATSSGVEDQIVELRKVLDKIGADAGTDTIRTHLEREGLSAPSMSTIQRILTRRGFITSLPKRRPKSSLTRLVAELPSECWQSDMTHWHLANGTGVQILTFIDDHSRLVLGARVHPTVTMENVRRLFAQTCDAYGTPASVLTDNGAIYNSISRGGRSGFESDLMSAGVFYKHSRPYHPLGSPRWPRWSPNERGPPTRSSRRRCAPFAPRSTACVTRSAGSAATRPRRPRTTCETPRPEAQRGTSAQWCDVCAGTTFTCVASS